MLSKITILSCVLFAATYPMCFWISANNPLRQNFHRFHLGLPTLVAGIVAVLLIPSTIDDFVKVWLVGWAGALLWVTFTSWKKESPNIFWVTLVCLIGLVTLVVIWEDIIGKGMETSAIAMAILGGLIFSCSLYAMNLGHWYLNVHGLPVDHLKGAVYALGCLLMLRVFADILFFLNQKVFYIGEKISLYQFSMTLEGFLIWLAVFFGSLFPLI